MFITAVDDLDLTSLQQQDYWIYVKREKEMIEQTTRVKP